MTTIAMPPVLADQLGAVAYSRNSSAKQKSIDDQRAENRRSVEANGWRLIAELSDPVSASRYTSKTRDEWAALLAMLPVIDVVVLWEPSRGDRSLATWAGFLDACRVHGVLIHAVTHHRTYDPRVARDYRSLAEDGVDSAYESDKISERTLRGLIGVMAKGHPHGRLAYGYGRTHNHEGDFATQFIDEVQGPVVRDIFASLAGGESLHSICARLSRGGVATPRGGKFWHTGTVTGIVRNPVYRPHPSDPERGCRTHKGEILDAPGAWSPLVDEATWQAANRVLGPASDPKVQHDDDCWQRHPGCRARRERRTSAPGAIKHLLSGNAAVMAAPCGSLLAGTATPTGARGSFYACRHDKCVSAPMGECDEYVSRLIVARFSKQDARHLWVADDTASRAAADEVARLRAELAEARESFAAPGGISASALAMKEGRMLPAIEDAERRSQPAGAPLTALRLLDAAAVNESLVRPTWDAFPVTAKRELISGVFESLVLGHITERINRWTIDKERLTIVANRISHVWRTP